MRGNDIKIVEIRDRATLIPAFAIRMRSEGLEERMLFVNAGYRSHYDACILLISIERPSCAARYSGDWERLGVGRSFPVAHKWIEENFDQIQNCQVIDVEFILGEKDAPSLSWWKEEMEIDNNQANFILDLIKGTVKDEDME